MKSLINLLISPIKILNFAGGIVGGLWLIINGQWRFILILIILGIVSVWIISLLLLPGLLFAVPVAYGSNHKKYFFSYLFGIINLVWTYVVMTAWSVASYVFILNQHTEGSIFPYLLLSYSLATSPWTYMAQKEQAPDLSATTIGAFFLCLGSLFLFIFNLISRGPSTSQQIIVFGISMVIAFILQLLLIISVIKKEKFLNQIMKDSS